MKKIKILIGIITILLIVSGININGQLLGTKAVASGPDSIDLFAGSTTTNGGSGATLGTQFRTDKNLHLTNIRVYIYSANNNAQLKYGIWDKSSLNLLESNTILTPSLSNQTLSIPVNVNTVANRDYIIGFYNGDGSISFNIYTNMLNILPSNHNGITWSAFLGCCHSTNAWGFPDTTIPASIHISIDFTTNNNPSISTTSPSQNGAFRTAKEAA